MPQVTVYIREEDLAVWRGIEKKSAFLHNALQQVDIYKSMSEPEKAQLKQKISSLIEPTKEIDSILEYKEDVSVRDLPAFKQFLIDYKFTGTPKPPHPDWGYPCCWDENKRCQHWDFDDVKSRYVNKFTHEVVYVL